MDMTTLAAQAAASAAVDDQTVEKSSFVYEVPAEGYTTARFVGYVEVGAQPQRPFQGVEKADAPEVRLTFELNGPKHKTEYKDAAGNDAVRYNTQREKITIGSNEKSNFQKLLKKMLAGRTDIKHMAQMLGEGFLIKLKHNKSKDGEKTYANMKVDGVWDIGAPAVTDPISNETTILEVPAATMPIQLLLWGAPSQEQWASIFIDGTYTKKDGDNTIEVSKNFIQEEAMSASNFVGSAIEAMIGGAAIADITKEMASPKEEEKAEAPKEAAEADDPLAALGL